MGRQNSLFGGNTRYTTHLIAYIDQVRKRTAQRVVMLGTLMYRKSDFSVRNGFRLYKQLILLMTDYACLACRSAARTHVRRHLVLQCKCLCFATGVSWCVSNRQIHEDLGVPPFADHIRALTAGFYSKLADVRYTIFGNSADTYATRGLTPSSDAFAKCGRCQQASQGHRPR
jgi:hypothetical protein